MKTLLLPFALLALLAGPAAAQPQPDPRAKDAEPLPDYPKLDPANKLVPLNPDKTLFAEVTAGGKVARVALATEVCLREGPLEVFLCKQGTKEHEAILRVDADAKFIHAALEAAGAKAGTPPRFVNPKTEQPEFKPATGTPIKVLVHYRKDGKPHTHPAQEWVWNTQKKQPLQAEWVFAGSQLIKDPCDPTRPPFYGANSGEVISVSNFTYSMLDLTTEISKDDANLNYEARTDRIPPLFSKVWVILEPVPAKK
jgi:hypothetical protein